MSNVTVYSNSSSPVLTESMSSKPSVEATSSPSTSPLIARWNAVMSLAVMGVPSCQTASGLSRTCTLSGFSSTTSIERA